MIVSADKDFNQLIRPGISQWIPPRGREPAVLLGPQEVEERWGVPPERVLDVLALVGDAVDNVPGVKGIGEKTATELIRTYGDLDSLYAQLDDDSEGRGPREAHRRARERVSVARTDPACEPTSFPRTSLDPYAVPDFRGRPGLLELLQRSRVSTVDRDSAAPKPAGQWQAAYEAISDPARLRELLAATRPADTDRDRHRDRTPSMRDARRPSASRSAGSRGVRTTCPSGTTGARICRSTRCGEILGPILADPSVEKTGQNMKFDLHVLHGLGLEFHGPLFDTLLASYLLDPDRPHDLDSLTLDLLGHRKIPTKELIGSGKQQTTMDLLDVGRVRDYAAEDADAVVRLHGVLLDGPPRAGPGRAAAGPRGPAHSGPGRDGAGGRPRRRGAARLLLRVSSRRTSRGRPRRSTGSPAARSTSTLPRSSGRSSSSG